MLNIGSRINGTWFFNSLGDDFENFGIGSIAEGGSFVVRLVRGAVGRGEKKREKLDLPIDAEYTTTPLDKQGILAILEKSADSTPQRPTVFVRCPKNFPVADMVSSSGQLLNMTINAKHDINCPGLAEILTASGISRGSKRKLDLYFCLPPGRYEKCKPTWTKPEGLDWVKQHVRIYALCIPLALPPFVEWYPLPLPSKE
jgi:hypothetical protein